MYAQNQSMNPNAIGAGQSVGIAAVPREPSLSQKVEEIASRAASINAALSSLDQHIERLIGGTLIGQASNQKESAPVSSIDGHLAYCSQAYALIEGRIATILQTLEHRL